MKKILSIAAVLMLVNAIGIVYAEEGAPVIKDTFLNYIDPTNAETARDTVAVTGGSAAGGIRGDSDTFLNYIDPSNAEEISRGPVKPGKVDAVKNMDTFLNYIDPGSKD